MSVTIPSPFILFPLSLFECRSFLAIDMVPLRGTLIFHFSLLLSFTLFIQGVLSQARCDECNLCATGCCSKDGFCGTTEEHCGEGCLSTCDFKLGCDAENPCQDGSCCNESGFCGFGPDCKFSFLETEFYQLLTLTCQTVPQTSVSATAMPRASAIQDSVRNGQRQTSVP